MPRYLANGFCLDLVISSLHCLFSTGNSVNNVSDYLMHSHVVLTSGLPSLNLIQQELRRCREAELGLNGKIK